MALLTTLTFAIPAVLALLAYVNQPPPPLTDDVLAMKRTGSYFNFHSAEFDEDYQVFYRDLRGDGAAGKNVFLMHGFPVSSYDWNEVLPGLQEEFDRLVVPEQLGYGLSDKPPGHSYTIAEQADIVESLLKSLRLEDAHFLCHDTGLTVCLELLARFNQRAADDKLSSGIVIRSFAFNNGGMFSAVTTPILIQRMAALPVLGTIIGALLPTSVAVRNLESTYGPRTKPSPALRKSLVSLMFHKGGQYALPRVLHYIHERLVFEDRWIGAMQTTSIPVHYIYSPADPVNLEATFQHFKSAVPKATTDRLPEHIGHFGMVEDPESFLKFYKRFLTSVTN